MEKDNTTISEKNQRLEEFFNQKRETWTKNLMPLFAQLKEPPQAIYEMQAEALSYRHAVNEEMAYFMQKLTRETSSMKQAKRDRFIYYATGFQLKTNTGEKNVLVDGDLAEVDRTIELMQLHIEFLRECIKTIDNIGYAIKNRVMLMEYLVK